MEMRDPEGSCLELAGDSQLVLLFWGLQEWESSGHCAGCSGGGIRFVLATLLVLLPCSFRYQPQECSPFMISERKEETSYIQNSPPGFSHLLPTLVDVNKLVDLDLLCLDRKIYF